MLNLIWLILKRIDWKKIIIGIIVRRILKGIFK
jgi:hypothetical protein